MGSPPIGNPFGWGTRPTQPLLDSSPPKLLVGFVGDLGNIVIDF